MDDHQVGLQQRVQLAAPEADDRSERFEQPGDRQQREDESLGEALTQGPGGTSVRVSTSAEPARAHGQQPGPQQERALPSTPCGADAVGDRHVRAPVQPNDLVS